MAQMLLSIELRPLSTIEGRKIVDGIYLSSLIPVLAERLKGSVCTAVGMSSSSAMSLCFRDGWLHLNATPDNPGLWWTETASVTSPVSPSWEHHIKGSGVEDVKQQGADRVLEIDFSEKSFYDQGGITLVFEATGRNANIILIRRKDGRILASLRKVLSSVNRYRSVSPGVVYKKPPSSGYPPSEWGSREVQDKLGSDVTAGFLYKLLEGVGPDSARAIMSHSDHISETVRSLGISLTRGDFVHWKTPFGMMPVKLGNGEAIQFPLAPPSEEGDSEEREDYRPSLRELEHLLRKGISREKKKTASAEISLGKLKSPDELRTFGSLILTWKKLLRKGMKEAVLENWEGEPVRIELRESLNPAENAERYFRKAGRIHLERERLEKRIKESESKIEELCSKLCSAGNISDEEASELLQRMRKPHKKETGGPLEFILPGGWRCFAGRNASQNDRLTFKIAGRDDIWLHARGIAGAHVIIRRDGRADNPGKAAIEQAAQIAARHSTSNGVVPVDWTLARYVRRMKGGGPGMVIYTREKTVFAQTN